MSTILRRGQTAVSLLLITLLGLPLITPLLHSTAVPCTHDGHLHYHRIAAMRYAWENGLYLSRWLPDVAFGYGYPFFIYREPTPLLAGLFPHLLGMPLPAASNLFYALCILASGWFMFLWVRDLLGETAAFVAAVTYMTAPYVLVDALIRGNSPESLALPLFPLLLWSGRRWVLNGRSVPFLIGVLSLAFLSLSHNISLLIFTPTLLVYLLAIGWARQIRWPLLSLRLLLLLGLGLGMTSFYTGGALLELDRVTLEQSTNTRNNDFRFNFATIGEIAGPVPAEDPLLLNPPLPFRLGWLPMSLAAIGIITFLAVNRMSGGSHQGGDRKKQQTKDARANNWAPTSKELTTHIWLMVAATAVYLFMALPASRWLWETLPLIDFVQFPWRFVGRASLPLAFLAGVPFIRLPHRWRWLALAAIGLLVIETVPNLYPNLCPEPSFPTINTVHEYERQTGLVGVDPEGSYFPRTVQRRPSGSVLEANYQASQPPQRFDTAVLPTGATLTPTRLDPLVGEAVIETDTPFTLRYFTFDFPGWTARLNGERIPITPSQPEGLITVEVPAGTHVVSIRWESTPLRSTLSWLSLLSLAATTAVFAILKATETKRTLPSISSNKSTAIQPFLLGLLLLSGVLIGLKTAVFDRVNTPLRAPAPPPVTQEVALNGGELALIGYNLSQPVALSGGTVDIDMAWTAVAAPTADYQTNVWLQAADGTVWSDKETFRPRLYEDAPRTLFWQPGQWAWDSREIQLLSGTPPGEYEIVVTLFDLETLAPLTLTRPNGEVVGPTASLGTLTVLPADSTPDFRPQVPLETAVLANQWRLLGYNQDRDAAQPGETLLLTLFWESLGANGETAVPLTLQTNGQTVKTWDLPLTPQNGPNRWEAGERLRSQHLLQLPGGLSTNTYQFELDGVVLGDIVVTAPERLFEPPDLGEGETAVLAPLRRQGRPLAELTSAALSQDGQQLQLTLLWQALAEFEQSYRVFVHLVDENGVIVAQADGEPVSWSRPTTGWAPGEYVRDSHTLTLPAGSSLADLAIRVGLYHPQTGDRLQAETADFIVLSLPLPDGP